ncbi:MAG: hypothetical protein IPO98_14730 [Saprospiraceae bacterium]|nr:hypothetical protein [Saprospiraceae bacterium]
MTILQQNTKGGTDNAENLIYTHLAIVRKAKRFNGMDAKINEYLPPDGDLRYLKPVYYQRRSARYIAPLQ